MRCFICNKQLTLKESEYDEAVGRFKDTCGECNSVSRETLRALEDQDYRHGWTDAGEILDGGVDDD